MKRLPLAAALLASSLLVACMDNDNDEPQLPKVEASFIEKPAGVYQGSLVTEADELVMVRAIYDSKGEKFYAYYPDNNDKAKYMLVADIDGRGTLTGDGETHGSLVLNNSFVPSGELNSLTGMELSFLHQNKVIKVTIDAQGNFSADGNECTIGGQLELGDTSSSYEINLETQGCGLPSKVSGIATQDSSDAPALLRVIAVGEQQLVDWLLYDA